MVNALCTGCGTPKNKPWKRCRGCGLDPTQDEDVLVKSVYLSVERFQDGDDRRRYAKQLDELGVRMRAGEEPAFEPAALEKLRKQKRLVESVPNSAVWGAVFRLFLPAIVVMVVLVIIIIVRRL